MLFSGMADAMTELFGFCCCQKRKLPITKTAMRIKTAAPINGHFEIADFGLVFAAAESEPYIPPTKDSMYRRTYPLSNAVYIYINRVPGKPISPRLKEFLIYVLSREGQQDVVDDGMYLPLNPEAAREQREKLQ